MKEPDMSRDERPSLAPDPSGEERFTADLDALADRARRWERDAQRARTRGTNTPTATPPARPVETDGRRDPLAWLVRVQVPGDGRVRSASAHLGQAPAPAAPSDEGDTEGGAAESEDEEPAPDLVTQLLPLVDVHLDWLRATLADIIAQCAAVDADTAELPMLITLLAAARTGGEWHLCGDQIRHLITLYGSRVGESAPASERLARPVWALLAGMYAKYGPLVDHLLDLGEAAPGQRREVRR